MATDEIVVKIDGKPRFSPGQIVATPGAIEAFRKAGEAFGIAGHVGRKDFEGDVASEFGVGGAVDLAHAASAEGADDAVVG